MSCQSIRKCSGGLTSGALTGHSGIKVHRGFYEGAKRHLEEIAAVVSERDSKARRRLPVWVTGHSLGGGYANALALHLLANRATAQLFGAGLQPRCHAASALRKWRGCLVRCALI